MNKIEQFFKETFDRLTDVEEQWAMFGIEAQVAIGIYKVDFTYNKCAVEIDGHEFHKTKEQREKDYIRERYLMRQGYTVIRFTGTEVFLHPEECVREMVEIGDGIELHDMEMWSNGLHHGEEKVRKEWLAHKRKMVIRQ
jgi:very-short-patch-repair endonuclease